MARPKTFLSLILAVTLTFTGICQAQIFTPFDQTGPDDGAMDEMSQFGPFGQQPQDYYGGTMRANQFEEIYHGLWAQIGNMYYNADALKDWAQWEHKFDGKLNSKEALEAALKAMIESLGDQWTRYVSVEDQIKTNQEAMFGYVSLGIFLKKAPDGRFEIDFLEWESAAQRSQLRRGDIIISINGTKLESMSQIQAANMMKAQEGNSVEVVYENAGKTAKTTLRAIPPAQQSVIVKIIGKDILYIRFPGFDSPERTIELVNGLNGVGQQFQKSVKGIVLDMRGNPGGEFQEALKVASIFMEEGTIVRSQTRAGRIISDQNYTVIAPLAHTVAGSTKEEKDFFTSLLKAPMVLLVDANTASAAEIVTGALKDNKRATVLGETTYGKGVGYVTGRGPTGGVITITGLQYLTPSGFNLAHKGLAPDIKVEQPREGDIDLQMTEAVKLLQEPIDRK
ncbi:MAG: PDZ domain-containing protein [Candidatus Obscuribacterales bacterium]|nr:PDZ domain-containing protein [Candidatus Obscuribacterales bacterium]